MIELFKVSSKIPSVVPAVIGAMILAPTLVGMGQVYAEEVSAENLVLSQTYIKTNNTNLQFGSSTPAFTPTTVQCPRYQTCTIRIEVSAQFANIQQLDVAGAALSVDNSTDGVLPNPVVGLDTISTNLGSSTARTFSWMKKNLTSGQHTVNVNFFTSTGGAADSPNRIQTIHVFINPRY